MILLQFLSRFYEVYVGFILQKSRGKGVLMANIKALCLKCLNLAKLGT